jgi:fibronectin type 3 domain-containing protein
MYYYKVSAVGSSIESALSLSISQSTVLSSPTGITAAALSASDVKVSWNAASGATGYYIYRAEAGTGTYVKVNASAFTGTSYSDTGLASSTIYYYKVSAVNSVGEGVQSEYAAATTLLAAPTGVNAATTSTSSITVSWNPVTGATGYRIYRALSASGTYTQISVSTDTSYVNTGLDSGATYYYKVSAYNAGEESVQSAYVVGVIMPAVPSGLTVSTVSSTSVTLLWNPVTGATSYRIYRSSSSLGTYTQIGTSTGVSYNNTGLSGATTYYYKVSAYNTGGESAQSGQVSATTTPAVPSGVTASKASSTSITVSWNPVTGATGYRVYRSLNSSGTYTQIGTSTGTSYTNTGLSNPSYYYYRVSAYSSVGESVMSSPAFARTD